MYIFRIFVVKNWKPQKKKKKFMSCHECESSDVYMSYWDYDY